MRSRSLLSSAVAVLAAFSAVPDVAIADDAADPDRRSSLRAVGPRVGDAAMTRTDDTSAAVTVAEAVRAYRTAVASRKPSLARQASSSTMTNAADAPATVPTITAPAPGSTVTGDVTVSVTSTASHVRFSGFGRTVDVPVSAGEASTTLPSWGYAGAQTLTAADCDETAACGAAATVDVTVSNPAPVLTRPASGATVLEGFRAAATAGGGTVQFQVDGVAVGMAPEAPYEHLIYGGNMSRGSTHVLTAVLCSATSATCDTSNPSAGVTFTVADADALWPEITAVHPSLFSPGTDGRRDTTTVTYLLESTQQVSWQVLDQSGTAVVPSQVIGEKSAGTHSFVFDGKGPDGGYLPSGRYTIELDTAVEITDATLVGHAYETVTIDRTLPTISSVSAAAVYPVRDYYKDTTIIKGVLSETVEAVTIQIRDSSGRTVRSLVLGGRSAGRFSVSWNGRRADGSILPAGTYRYRFVLRDRAGNQASSTDHSVNVSAKKLVKRVGSKTVSAAGSMTGYYRGACSALATPGKRGWKKSIGYYSDARNDGKNACRKYQNHDLAATDHATRLVSAPRYGSMTISAYGGKTRQKSDDKAALVYYNWSGNLSSKGRTLGSAVKKYVGPSVLASLYMDSRGRVRWLAGTVRGNFYDIKSFTIDYTYFVLR